MRVKTHTFSLETQGFSDVIDITRRVEEALAESGLGDGLLAVYVPGSTAGVTTIEYESGAVADLKAAIERMAPQDIPYAHDARWG
ncbi:MAG: YjbQ family protein, partial [Nitrospinota bacterium]